MKVPVDRIAGAARMAGAAKRDADAPVRVTVLVDASATPFLVDAVRRALVPRTTSGIVRVSRLGEAEVKPDTDVAIVLTCGSAALEGAVQRALIAGAPVAVLAESSVEVPFIDGDGPMLGLIAATDEAYLLESLARWILDRTEKGAALAANFPFMRPAFANRAIANAALANMATGALAFIPGADFPVMVAAQLGMMSELAGAYGKPLRAERAYEAAGVLAAGLALRAAARRLAPAAGRAGFAVKALTAAGGTYAMGRALAALYEADVDYGPLNDALAGAFRRGRDLFAGAVGATGEGAPCA